MPATAEDIKEARDRVEYKKYFDKLKRIMMQKGLLPDENGSMFMPWIDTPEAVVTTKQMIDNACYIMGRLIAECGLTTVQAAGMAGVFCAESGCNPTACNKAEKYGSGVVSSKYGSFRSTATGAGYGAGIMQWSNTLKTQVMQMMASAGYKNANAPIETWGLQMQTTAVVKMMNERGQKFKQRLRGARTLQEAVDLVLRGWENGDYTRGVLRSVKSCDAYKADGGYVGLMKRRMGFAQKCLEAYSNSRGITIPSNLLQPTMPGGSAMSWSMNATPSFSGPWNIAASVNWIMRAARGGSKGKCAKYVRMALEAGGLSTVGRPVSACNYKGFLPRIGFGCLGAITGKAQQARWTASQARPGDIAVMDHGKHGHICLYTGSRWVSDFVQNNMWVYGGDGTCYIFRHGASSQFMNMQPPPIQNVYVKTVGEDPEEVEEEIEFHLSPQAIAEIKNIVSALRERKDGEEVAKLFLDWVRSGDYNQRQSWESFLKQS